MRNRHLLPAAAWFATALGGLLPATNPCLAQRQDPRPSLAGRVVDDAGQPVVGARVRIATARVRQGISPY